MTHLNASLSQSAFRGRTTDAVALNSATFDVALNTNWTQDRDTPFRLRIAVEEVNGGSENSDQFILQYNRNGGGWVAADALLHDSAQFAQDDATSQLITTGTFLAGAGIDTTNLNANGISFSGNDSTELEYALLLPNTWAALDTVQFRVVYSGGTLLTGSYSQTPTVTVSVTADTTPPGVPSGVSATGGDTIVDLAWTDPGDADLAGIRIYRSTTQGSGYSLVHTANPGDQAWQDTGLTNGITYYYVLTSIDEVPNESAQSSEVSATPMVGGTPISASDLSWLTPGYTPGNFGPFVNSSGHIYLFTGDFTNAKIRVCKSTDGGATWNEQDYLNAPGSWNAYDDGSGTHSSAYDVAQDGEVLYVGYGKGGFLALAEFDTGTDTWTDHGASTITCEDDPDHYPNQDMVSVAAIPGCSLGNADIVLFGTYSITPVSTGRTHTSLVVWSTLENAYATASPFAVNDWWEVGTDNDWLTRRTISSEAVGTHASSGGEPTNIGGHVFVTYESYDSDGHMVLANDGTPSSRSSAWKDQLNTWTQPALSTRWHDGSTYRWAILAVRNAGETNVQLVNTGSTIGSWTTTTVDTTAMVSGGGLVVDMNGTLHAIWVKDDGSSYPLLHSSYDGSTWATPDTLISSTSVNPVSGNVSPDGSIVRYVYNDGSAWRYDTYPAVTAPSIVVGAFGR